MNGFIYQIIISSSAQSVWDHLTTAEFTRQFWFGRSVESDWIVGHPVKVVTPDGQNEVLGEIKVSDKPVRLAYTWNAQMDKDPDRKETLVTFEIQEMGPLVKLTVTQDLDPASKQFIMAAQGWTFILNGLKTLLETGKPLPALPWKKPE